MKNIIFLFLFPAVVCGQTAVTKDSVWQTSENGAFYETRLVEYSNGESSLNKRLIGDTLTVFNSYLSVFTSEANRMANASEQTKDFDRTLRGMLDRRDSILATLGKDLTDTLAAKYAAPLLQSGWNILQDTANLSITWSISNSGQLRYEIEGYVTRNAFIFGRAIRMNNYRDTGKSLDIYAMPGGNWVSLDNAVKMKLPGNQGLSRTVSKPPTESRTVHPAKKETAKKKPTKQKRKN